MDEGHAFDTNDAEEHSMLNSVLHYTFVLLRSVITGLLVLIALNDAVAEPCPVQAVPVCCVAEAVPGNEMAFDLSTRFE